MGHWVGILAIQGVLGIVHHYHLRVSCLSLSCSLPPYHLCIDGTIVGAKDTGETVLIVHIGLPDHALLPRVGGVILPSGIIKYTELSL